MAIKLLSLVATLAALKLVQVQAGKIDANTKTVCNSLYDSYPGQVIWDPLEANGYETIGNTSVYHESLTSYWNAKNEENRPACVFSPSNADQLSAAVKLFNQYPSVDFALKCGGHNPNLGYSSVADGVLVAFRPNSQYVTLSDDKKTIEAGAGAKWEDIYAVTQPEGKTVVGGRLGDIGITGFTLGGGLSYLSAQYGFACDNVLNFECVLANGTITNANATANPDLFAVLKGGGNQFAAISKITFKTYDIGDNGMIWGGSRTYTGDKHDAVHRAISNFIATNTDPKAAIIPVIEFISAAVVDLPAFIVFFFYDDGAAPPAGIFDEFDAITSLSDSTEVTPYTTLTTEASSGKIEGLRFQIRENTLPNMPVDDMADFLDQQFDNLKSATAKASLEDLLDIHLFTSSYQPMPVMIAQASKDAGGNMLNLDPAAGDRLWMEYDLAWLSPLCDDKCKQFLIDTGNDQHDLHKEKFFGTEPTNYESGDLEYVSYNPTFMNDAMYDQDVFKGYGDESYALLTAAKAKYDPDGFWTEHLKGFKLS